MKYDTQTLLALRHSAKIEMDRFSVHAFSNNLLGRRKNRASFLSELSSNKARDMRASSYQSEAVSSTASERGLEFPIRQPYHPPQGALAQTNAGFAQFLKKHTSPKHQRVTAGGRIVPMEPTESIPKMKPLVRSKNAKARKRSMAKELKSNRQADECMDISEHRQTLVGETVDGHYSSPSEPSVTADPIKRPRVPSINSQGFQIPDPLPDMQPSPITNPFSQPTCLMSNGQLLPTLQQPGDCMLGVPSYGPLNFRPDQTNWLSNSIQTWNWPYSAGSSITTAGTPLSTFSAPPLDVSPPYSQVYSFTPALSPVVPSTSPFNAYIAPSGGYCDSKTAADTNSQSSLMGSYGETAFWKLFHETVKDHEAISNQLNQLDRYMAMHAWDIDTNSKNLLVEQRRGLVRDLDSVRLRKEQLESVLSQAKANATSFRKEKTTTLLSQVQPIDLGPSQHSQLPWVPGCLGNWGTPGLSSPTPMMNPYFPLIHTASTSFQWQDINNPCLKNQECGDLHINLAYTGDIEQPCYENWTTDTSQAQGLLDDPTDNRPVTTTKSKPSTNLRQLYRKIDEANRRGDPIDGLLKDLAAITLKLTSSKSHESSEHSELGIGKGSHLASKTASRGSQLSQSKHSNQAQTDPGDGAALAQNHTTMNTLSRKTSSEAYVADSDDDSISCSSTATGESMATVHRIDTCQASKQVDSDNENEGSDDRLKGSFSDSTRKKISISSTGSPSPKKRDTVQRTRYMNSRNRGSHESFLSILSTNSAAAKRDCPQFFTQYLKGDGTLVPQKTAALAISQSINAHAFLPPFDGAGDFPASRTSGPVADEDDVAAQSAENGRVEKAGWYERKRRPRPSPAVLQAFFRQIERDEDNMIHQYYMGQPYSMALE
ncbi:hypothetical protein ASPZODRAFT_21405 [Penicilliopsis zonata CBS 506.65]|uniref:Uncharacterized protein n=1 Tax=Penicilliopsis zonata CBS 506.65 TaxID=1073090 RepID=A0A1L9SUM3_9EURO|nr:hypothetical protein ASPZODRAFT_21405 [Penicilliopsis zonata CBS 506.65]OJJ50898.1 hypothetical protein ASPZODRAFT_21405 [Penicilliopsis zonata CBS 506.65]